MRKILMTACLIAMGLQAMAQKVDQMVAEIEPKVIEWRRDFHQNPELSNREFETSKKVAAFLEGLGMEVQTGLAHTGVVGILKGGKPGPVVALRADMDGLPVTERVDLPFASIHENQVRQSGELAISRIHTFQQQFFLFFQCVVEPSGQHFIHGSIVIRTHPILDLELPVVAFLRFAVLKDNHGTDGGHTLMG